MAIEVTDEMRQAVYEADCEAKGHMFVFDRMFQSTDGHTSVVSGPDPDTLPHVRCQRCPKVWLLIDDPGNDYADAVAKLRGRGAPVGLVRPRRFKGQLRRPEALEA
ncbi:hypothetical protein Psed_5808 [Pseudonocardia dioxanivorans CB1190]|uniref:Uncharacterized protein n=1 Tax=Pseudonocardia dioxanivorans (strain ATCC 55486 / DSM 44775 / JCM 13855 / CB1190) TaxID=675635 RepID=F4D1E5_PSEUX|nr:hypothetical protein [Pseudonocardia dioxanivorans]AEA27933.1 hypothetical protein Psed_5808 [Pseudonocardia dioxanivorans CB1190]